jgi:hypothetical protein
MDPARDARITSARKPLNPELMHGFAVQQFSPGALVHPPGAEPPGEVGPSDERGAVDWKKKR